MLLQLLLSLPDVDGEYSHSKVRTDWRSSACAATLEACDSVLVEVSVGDFKPTLCAISLRSNKPLDLCRRFNFPVRSQTHAPPRFLFRATCRILLFSSMLENESGHREFFSNYSAFPLCPGKKVKRPSEGYSRPINNLHVTKLSYLMAFCHSNCQSKPGVVKVMNEWWSVMMFKRGWIFLARFSSTDSLSPLCLRSAFLFYHSRGKVQKSAEEEFWKRGAVAAAVCDEWVSGSVGSSAARALIEEHSELSCAQRRQNEMTEAGSGAERSQSCTSSKPNPAREASVHCARGEIPLTCAENMQEGEVFASD